VNILVVYPYPVSKEFSWLTIESPDGANPTSFPEQLTKPADVDDPLLIWYEYAELLIKDCSA
jgi:hypothetical protein